MKRKYIFFLLIFTGLISVALKLQPYSAASDLVEEVAPPARKPSEIDYILPKYDSLLTQEIENAGTVGAAVAIVYKGQIAFLKCYGVRKEGEKAPVDKNTIFRLGSVSKTVTGVLAGILSEEGAVDLDTRVKDVLPGFTLSDTLNANHLTVRNLLSHTSGLVPHAYDNLVEDHVPFGVIMDSLSRVNIAAPPGRLYGYQNVVFSLYDTVSALKTSKDFGSLMKAKVFDPFGMEHASTSFKSFSENPDKAFPHYRYRARRYKPLPLNDRYYNTCPAAGVNASISDMAKFLRGIMGDDNLRQVMDTVLTPQVYTALRWSYLRYWDHPQSKQYALGWRIIGYKGRDVAYHAGYVQGYKSEIAYCQDEQVGIVYLTNSPNKAASVSVPEFLDMYFALKDSLKEETAGEELASQ